MHLHVPVLTTYGAGGVRVLDDLRSHRVGESRSRLIFLLMKSLFHRLWAGGCQRAILRLDQRVMASLRRYPSCRR
jgi:hypothetical protein